MLLSDRDILDAHDKGRFTLDPFDKTMVQPASIDVRLDRFFRVFNNQRCTHIDPALNQSDLTTEIEVDGDEAFVLHPHEFALAATFECLSLDGSLASRVEGKSSLGRLGLLAHATAGFIDPGFSGHVTLELSNVSPLPVKLWPGMKIAQLCLIPMSSSVEIPYGSGSLESRYQQAQRGPTVSRSYIGFQRFGLG